MGIDLKHGDCLELMKNIPDGSVDMILCDLPYGTTRNSWDERIDLDKLWTQYNRILKIDGAVVLNCQQPFTTDLINSNRKHFKYLWYWDKHMKTNFLNANKQPLRQIEEIAVFYRKQPTFNPPKEKAEPSQRTKPGRKVSTNYGEQKNRTITSSDELCASTLISDFPKINFEGGHPTQKPVPLLEYLIKTYTKAGETVLDNCMGSGSTGVACVNTGRNFVGIEKDNHYFETAKERIEKAQKLRF